MEYAWLALLGFAIGALGTLIGAGGGFILMPILLLFYPHESPAILTATSLTMIFFNAASGSISYARMKRIDIKSGLIFATAGIPSAILGANVVHYIPRQAFNLVFGLLLVGVAVFLFRRPEKESGPAARLGAQFKRTLVEADGTRHEFAFNLPLGITISFIVGFLSSLLGIGGGIIHVPAMVHVLDFPVHVATATSHFVLMFMALTGTIMHLVDGSLQDVTQALLLSAGAVAGAQLGAKLSRRVHGRWIMKGLAIALGMAGLRILVQTFWR